MYFIISFLLLKFFLAGNIIVYTPSQGTNREKYNEKMTKSEWECRIWREINNLSIHPFPLRTLPFHLSIEKGRPNPSGMDIKVFISVPTFCLQTTRVFSKKRKLINISLLRKNRIKIKIAWLKYENNTFEKENDIKNIHNCHHRAHFIVIYSSLSVLTLYK